MLAQGSVYLRMHFVWLSTPVQVTDLMTVTNFSDFTKQQQTDFILLLQHMTVCCCRASRDGDVICQPVSLHSRVSSNTYRSGGLLPRNITTTETFPRSQKSDSVYVDAAAVLS